MSIVAMNWAWSVRLEYLSERDNKAARRLLLVALGDNANEQGTCWPSITTLAKRAESSPRSVHRWLGEFVEHQLLSVSHRRNDAGQTSNLYCLHLDRQVAEKHPTPLTPCQGVGDDTVSPPPCHGVTPPMPPDGRGPLTPGGRRTTNEPNPNPHSHSGAGIFERAAEQDDDGTPEPSLPRRFAMTLDWQPDEGELAVACLRAGLAQNIKPEPHQLAKFTAHHADSGRAHGTTAWLAKLVDWLRNDLRNRRTPAGGSPHGDQHADQQRDGRAEREAVRQQLANPHDLSWADGLWGEPDEGPEPGAQGADEPVGGAGVHPAGGDFPADVQQCVPEHGHADPGTPRAGAGTGQLAGPADQGGGGTGDERAQARGEYLAADDSGAGQPAGAHGGGLRYAGRR